MSLTISTQLFGKLEARMEDLREAAGEDMASVQKAVDRLVKTFAELRGTATSGAASASAASDSEAQGAVKGKKLRKSRKDADGDGEPKAKRPPTEWSIHCTNVLFPLIMPAIKEAKEAEKLKEDDKREIKTGFHLSVAGYLKNSGKMNPTEDEVKEAIEYLLSHPDHKSETQKIRSASNSTDEAPKKLGRPKKAESASAPVVTTTAATEDKVAEAAAVIAKLDAVLGESDDEDSDDEEDEKEDVPLVDFEYKGTKYLKDPFQEVYTATGRMKWVGTFNGKKIVKGEEPARVKKLIASQD